MSGEGGHDLTSTPDAASDAIRSGIRMAPVWNTLAARAPETLARSKTSRKCETAPAPPDAIRGMVSRDRAERLIEDIGLRLGEADRAALDVHPWRRRLARYTDELQG